MIEMREWHLYEFNLMCNHFLAYSWSLQIICISLMSLLSSTSIFNAINLDHFLRISFIMCNKNRMRIVKIAYR